MHGYHLAAPNSVTLPTPVYSDAETASPLPPITFSQDTESFYLLFARLIPRWTGLGLVKYVVWCYVV